MKLLSKCILKQSIRGNWILWTVLTALFSINAFFLPAMDLSELPTSMQDAGLTSMFGNIMFDGMGIILLLVYAIIVGNKLVASEIDKGTMSFALNTPTTRRQIILTKTLFYIASILAMVIVPMILATISTVIFDAPLDLGRIWLMTLAFILFILATAGICFFASCWFNRSSFSLALGAGLPLLFYVFISLSGLDNFGFLEYLSLNTLYVGDQIALGQEVSTWIGQMIALVVIAIALFTGGIIKFLRKDLPL